MAEVLRKDMDASRAASVESLSPDQLKLKIGQLEAEISMRSKAEAVRLSEFLVETEKRWQGVFEANKNVLREQVRCGRD